MYLLTLNCQAVYWPFQKEHCDILIIFFLPFLLIFCWQTKFKMQKSWEISCLVQDRKKSIKEDENVILRILFSYVIRSSFYLRLIPFSSENMLTPLIVHFIPFSKLVEVLSNGFRTATECFSQGFTCLRHYIGLNSHLDCFVVYGLWTFCKIR